MEGISLSLWMASSAKMGTGLRSVSHALSSRRSFGIGCSTMTTPCSFSQKISSKAFSLSFQPWFASTATGRSVTSRMARIICSSLSKPTFTLRILNLSAHSVVFSRTTSGASMPIVKVVLGALPGFSPQILYQGSPISLPTRSCSAMSTAALAAVSPSPMPSTYVRISSVWKGSLNCSKFTFWRNFVTVSTLCPR